MLLTISNSNMTTNGTSAATGTTTTTISIIIIIITVARMSSMMKIEATIETVKQLLTEIIVAK